MRRRQILDLSRLNAPFKCPAGNCPITSALLKAGARVDSRGFRHNDTPLHIAARYGRAEVASLLLEHGASPSAKNMLNQTPLQIAKEHHQAAVITLLEESARCGGQGSSASIAGLSFHAGGRLNSWGDRYSRGLGEILAGLRVRRSIR